MNNPHISIIIPVYNAEAYLHECIESLQRQRMRSFEIIIVDDGSADKSPEICNQLAIEDERIRIIHQANAGASAARDRGVQMARGEYVTFVDADDTLPQDALESLAKEAKNGKFDIVVGNIDRCIRYQHDVSLSPKDYRAGLLTLDRQIVTPSAKLFRRSLFCTETFDLPRDIKIGEDRLMNLRLAFANKKEVRQITKIVYNYRVTSGSATQTFRPTVAYYQRYFDFLKMTIPEDLRKAYYPLTIAYRLKVLELIGIKNPEDLTTKDGMRADLLKDIKACNYPLSLHERFYLRERNSLAIKAFNFMRRVENKLVMALGRKSILP